MKEVKNSKKPFLYYYMIVLLVMILLNTLFIPKALSPKVKQVGYDTFLDMIDTRKIKEVQVEDNQIIFSDTEESTNYYKTGVFYDPGLVDRLHEAGAEFGTEDRKSVV